MRITNSIMQREALSAIQRNNSAMDEAQRQVTTGLRIQNSSDDPVAAAEVLRDSSALRALTQYRRNIGSARTRLNTEESVLDQVTNLLTRAKELGVGQAGSTSNGQTRAIAQKEVDQLQKQLAQLANTQVNGAYLFGGDFADQKPFDANGNALTTATASASQVAISSGRSVATNHDGNTVFIQSGVIAAVNDLSTALTNNDPAAIATSLGSLDSAFNATQTMLGEVGARTNQLDIASSNVDALEVTLKTTKSDLSEVEMEAAVTTLVSRQTAYQAALQATSRILTTHLTDYLR